MSNTVSKFCQYHNKILIYSLLNLHFVSIVYIFCRKNKVRLLKGDWTSQLCSCPADKPEIFTNEVVNPGRDCDEVPDGADLLWKVKPRPSCSDEVNSKFQVKVQSLWCNAIVQSINSFIPRTLELLILSRV